MTTASESFRDKQAQGFAPARCPRRRGRQQCRRSGRPRRQKRASCHSSIRKRRGSKSAGVKSTRQRPPAPAQRAGRQGRQRHGRERNRLAKLVQRAPLHCKAHAHKHEARMSTMAVSSFMRTRGDAGDAVGGRGGRRVAVLVALVVLEAAREGDAVVLAANHVPERQESNQDQDTQRAT